MRHKVFTWIDNYIVFFKCLILNIYMCEMIASLAEKLHEFSTFVQKVSVFRDLSCVP